jgi:hypothetical protein
MRRRPGSRASQSRFGMRLEACHYHINMETCQGRHCGLRREGTWRLRVACPCSALSVRCVFWRANQPCTKCRRRVEALRGAQISVGWGAVQTLTVSLSLLLSAPDNILLTTNHTPEGPPTQRCVFQRWRVCLCDFDKNQEKELTSTVRLVCKLINWRQRIFLSALSSRRLRGSLGLVAWAACRMRERLPPSEKRSTRTRRHGTSTE